MVEFRRRGLRNDTQVVPYKRYKHLSLFAEGFIYKCRAKPNTCCEGFLFYYAAFFGGGTFYFVIEVSLLLGKGFKQCPFIL